MFWPQCFLPYGQTALVERQGLRVVATLAIEDCEVEKNGSNIRMLWSKRLLPNVLCTFVERFCFRIVTLSIAIKFAEIVQSFSQIRVFQPQRFLHDGQCTPVERLRLLIVLCFHI